MSDQARYIYKKIEKITQQMENDRLDLKNDIEKKNSLKSRIINYLEEINVHITISQM